MKKTILSVFTFALSTLAFDVYPDITDQQTGGTAGGRFLYSSEVSQHGQLGRHYTLALKYRF